MSSEMRGAVARHGRSVIDILVLALALVLAFALRFDWDIPTRMGRLLLLTLPPTSPTFLMIAALVIPKSPA